MASKANLIQQITNRSLRIIETVLEQDSAQQAVGINRYRVNALVEEGGRVRARDTFFYVIDEGPQNEAAYYRRKAEDEVVHAAVQNYVDSLTPGTFVRANVTEVDEENGFALADAYELSGQQVTLKKIIIARVGQNMVHREIV